MSLKLYIDQKIAGSRLIIAAKHQEYIKKIITNIYIYIYWYLCGIKLRMLKIWGFIWQFQIRKIPLFWMSKADKTEKYLRIWFDSICIEELESLFLTPSLSFSTDLFFSHLKIATTLTCFQVRGLLRSRLWFGFVLYPFFRFLGFTGDGFESPCIFGWERLILLLCVGWIVESGREIDCVSSQKWRRRRDLDQRSCPFTFIYLTLLVGLSRFRQKLLSFFSLI